MPVNKQAIISDATTLIVLSRLERFDLLANLFEQVLIPQSVYDEISAKPFDLPDRVRIQPDPDSPLQQTLQTLLDPGESAAIALAKKKSLRLIIDEKKGRMWARQVGVEIIGFVGILLANIYAKRITAEEGGALPSRAQQAGMRISEAVIEQFYASLPHP